MKPVIRFNSIALSLSTLIIFSLWEILNKIHDLFPSLIIFTGLIISLSVYRLVVNLLAYLLDKSMIVKKFIYGSSYLEGTWIGFYIGVNGSVRYLIERHEQEFDSLVIKGKSFDDNLNFHSMWTADAVSIDVKKGELTYMYNVSALSDVSNNVGIAIFNFERVNSQKAPTKLIGYSSDLHIAKKVKAMEIKVDNDSDQELLKKAKILFNENQDNF